MLELTGWLFKGGTVHGSINLPAQSLYPTIPSLYTLFSAAGVSNVIWYCGESPNQYLIYVLTAHPSSKSFIQTVILALSQANTYKGSSMGRGSRAAGWFADYIKEQNDTRMESRVLEGGIKGWASSGDEYVTLMDDYDAAAWK